MDRTFGGLIAGICGGIVMNVLSYISYYFNFAAIRFVDWSAIFIFGFRAPDIWHHLVALTAQILWAGFLGVIFAFLIPLIGPKGYLIKGAYFGFISSFLIYAMPCMFHVEELHILPVETAITEISGGTIWGLTTAYVLHRLGYVVDPEHRPTE